MSSFGALGRNPWRLAQDVPYQRDTPQAQYFLAVSKYRASRHPEDLVRNWKRVQERYPNGMACPLPL